jgi:hypothetical protein
MTEMTSKLALALGVSLVLVCSAPAVSQDRRGGSRWERMARWDTNADGKISRDEFRGRAEMFDRMDRDGDGFVTEKEAGSGGGMGRGGQGQRQRNDDWIFKLLDRDADGVFTNADIDALRRMADTDGDGKLSEAEFDEFLKKRSTPPRGTAPAEGATAPVFSLARLDAEGELTLDALRAGGKPVVLVFGSFT